MKNKFNWDGAVNSVPFILRRNRMGLLDVYAEYFSNYISGGNLISRDKISLLGLKPLYDRYLTNGFITKIWVINRVPVYMGANLTQAIRQEMFALCPSVKTTVSMYNVPLRMNVTSDIFKRHLKKSANAYNQYKEVFDSLSDDEKLLGAVERSSTGQRTYINSDMLDRIKMMYDSYTYVYSEATHGKQFVHTYYFIQASARNKRDMKEFQKHLTTFLSGEQISFKPIRGTISQYLANFCPGTYIQDNTVKNVDPMLFSQENVAALSPCKTKGLVGDKGILMGIDAQTKLPFMLDFKASGAAQVIMWLAKSGAGKTFAAFFTALELLGDNTHCSAIDIKGNEWNKLAPYVDTTVISMDDTNPRFVNTMRLDDLECTKSDCQEAFNTAVRDTVTLLSLMVNIQDADKVNPSDVDMILEQAVMKMYNKRDVYKDNPDTFYKTRDMNYAEILDIVDQLSATHSYTPEQVRCCDLIRTRCANYFLAEGRYSDAFKNEITVGEIINKPMVIYSFNKNSTSMLDTLDTIRVFMVQALDGRKTTLRKRKRLHTAAFYEELQRCDQFGKLITYISHRVTGSRSDNVTIFLLLNAVSTFNNEDLGAIKSNITTKIVGLVEDGDIPILVKEFGCGPIEEYLKMINGEERDYWRNCFAIQYDTGLVTDKCVYKVVLPDYMQEQFATRDIYE